MPIGRKCRCACLGAAETRQDPRGRTAQNCETKEGKIDRIEREITLEGDLDAEQRAKLMEIADKCPVHRTLQSKIDIRPLSGRPSPSSVRPRKRSNPDQRRLVFALPPE